MLGIGVEKRGTQEFMDKYNFVHRPRNIFHQGSTPTVHSSSDDNISLLVGYVITRNTTTNALLMTQIKLRPARL